MTHQVAVQLPQQDFFLSFFLFVFVFAFYFSLKFYFILEQGSKDRGCIRKDREMSGIGMHGVKPTGNQ